MITAADLLEGPRGRRFLLELLTAVMPGHGDVTARVRRAVGRAVTSGDDDAARELARALIAAPVGEPTPEQVVVALEETAESALWWQSPHDEDVALGLPGVRDGLRHLAEWAVASGAVAASASPMPSRWTIETEHWPRVEGRPEAAAALRAWAEDLREEQRKGTDGRVSGVWWNTVPWPLVSTTGAPFPELGPMALWAVEDSFGPEHAVVRQVVSDRRVRVGTIDSPEDWAELCRRWPLDVGRTSRRYDWMAATGRDGDWVVPDWSAVAEEYDVVHLTVVGWFRTSGTVVPVDAHRASVVSGWTPDTTCWLTDPAPEEGQPTLWVRDQNTGPWRRGAD